MGDSGSLLLGLQLRGADAERGRTTAAAASDLLSIVAVPVLVLLIPIFDTDAGHRVAHAVGAIARRRRPRSLVASARRDWACPSARAVALLWLLAGIGGGIGVAVDYFNLRWAGVVGVALLRSR